MSAIPFPSNASVLDWKNQGDLDQALDLYARVLVSHHDQLQIAQWCRQYLSSETPLELKTNLQLRRAVYCAIFRSRLLVDSSVETYWNIAVSYGPTNEQTVVEYFRAAPRSVPIKLSRFLLYQAETGDTSKLTTLEFQNVVTIILSARNIADSVITPEWRNKLKTIKTAEARVLSVIADYFESQGPVHTLAMLLPQLSLSKIFGLLLVTGLSVEQLSEHIFEDPDYVENALAAGKPKETPSRQGGKRFLKLDAKERQAREDAIRRHNQEHFSYKYVSLEDEDPEPEVGPVEPELSEADKKLNAQEEVLWDYWQKHKDVFSLESRKSELRKTLRNKLKWTNEQIEGWGRVIGEKGRFSNPTLEGAFEEVETYAPESGGSAKRQQGKHSRRSDNSSTDAKNGGNATKKSSREQSPRNTASNTRPNKPPGASARVRPKKSGKKDHSVKE